MTRNEERAIQRELLRIEREVINQIAINYSRALDNIRKEIMKISEKYEVNGKLTYAEMSKYNRLTNLEKSIINEMNDMYIRNGRATGRLMGVQYAESYYRHYYGIMKSAGMDISFGLLSPETIRAAVENPLEKIAIRGLKANGIVGIRRVITQGLIQGRTGSQMMKDIKEFINADRRRQEAIVRTESQRAQVLGCQACYDDLDDRGVEIIQIWLATLDDRTRPDHQNLDGKEKQENGWYVLGIGWVAGPLQSGVAEFDINCRCTVMPEIRGFPTKYRRVKGEGITEFQTYKQYAKSRGIKAA